MANECLRTAGNFHFRPYARRTARGDEFVAGVFIWPRSGFEGESVDYRDLGTYGEPEDAVRCATIFAEHWIEMEDAKAARLGI